MHGQNTLMKRISVLDTEIYSPEVRILFHITYQEDGETRHARVHCLTGQSICEGMKTQGKLLAPRCLLKKRAGLLEPRLRYNHYLLFNHQNWQL